VPFNSKPGFRWCNLHSILGQFAFWRDSLRWARASSVTRFLDHPQRRTTVGRTPLDEWSAHRRDLYLTTHNTHKRQTSMPPVGFEPIISAGKRSQAYALDRADNETGDIGRVTTNNRFARLPRLFWLLSFPRRVLPEEEEQNSVHVISATNNGQCPKYTCLSQHQTYEYISLAGWHHTPRLLSLQSPLSRNTNKMQLCNRIYYSKVF